MSCFSWGIEAGIPYNSYDARENTRQSCGVENHNAVIKFDHLTKIENTSSW